MWRASKYERPLTAGFLLAVGRRQDLDRAVLLSLEAVDADAHLRLLQIPLGAIEEFNPHFGNLNTEPGRDKPFVDCWRLDYNHRRPHSAFDYQTPAEFAAPFTPDPLIQSGT
ncbi:MAG: transposase [Planctomycetes bacterium]|nr:transposase [Planctomycetota bacterium]